MEQLKAVRVGRITAATVLSFLLLFSLLTPLCPIPIATAQTPVSIYYFYAEDCPHCQEMMVVIEELEATYPVIEVHKLEISYNTTNSDLFNDFILTYNPPAVDIPAFFIGTTSLIGSALTKERLEAEIELCLHDECPDPLTLIMNGSGAEESQSPLLIMLMGTALVEGINPCGFAVLIVLLASLLFAESKRRILYVGLAFIASVFFTHVFVGFGIMEFYLISGLTPIMRALVIVIVLAAGIINIRDFWRDKATLAIPSALKPKLAKLAGYASTPGAVLLGFLATIAGLPCTGPLYLTMLDLIAEVPSNLHIYLILYNALYVLPLVVILVIVYKGTSPENAEEWRKGTRRYMKLIAGVVMVAIGVAMLFGVI